MRKLIRLHVEFASLRLIVRLAKTAGFFTGVAGRLTSWTCQEFHGPHLFGLRHASSNEWMCCAHGESIAPRRFATAIEADAAMDAYRPSLRELMFEVKPICQREWELNCIPVSSIPTVDYIGRVNE